MSQQENAATVEPVAAPVYPAVIVGGKAKLTCPHCGAKGLDNFIYLEEVQSYRKLISLKRKLLLIYSFYKVFDEGAKNPCLVCQTCDKECSIPNELELDWE